MRKKAQSILEYALIIAVIALASGQVLNKFGLNITKVGNRANAEVNNNGVSPDAYCKKIGCSGYNPGSGNCSNCPLTAL